LVFRSYWKCISAIIYYPLFYTNSRRKITTYSLTFPTGSLRLERPRCFLPAFGSKEFRNELACSSEAAIPKHIGHGQGLLLWSWVVRRRKTPAFHAARFLYRRVFYICRITSESWGRKIKPRVFGLNLQRDDPSKNAPFNLRLWEQFRKFFRTAEACYLLTGRQSTASTLHRENNNTAYLLFE
jgi:hypothetical protein